MKMESFFAKITGVLAILILFTGVYYFYTQEEKEIPNNNDEPINKLPPSNELEIFGTYIVKDDKTSKLIKKMRNDDLEEIKKLKIWINETSKKKNIFLAITVVAILSTIITFALATEYAYLFIVVVILVITTIICSKNAKIYKFHQK